MIYPTLTFDERGHNKNTVFYGALAKEMVNGKMESPVSFCPVTEEFIGEGGNFENPYYVAKNKPLPYTEGQEVDGYETVAAIRFNDCELKPGESRSYVIALEYGTSKEELESIGNKYIDVDVFDKYLEETKMSKYKFAQRSGISLSTIYDIIRKEDYDIRESNIIKICHGMQIEPFDLFQTSEEILVLEKDEEIQAILEARSLPEEYREIMLEYLHSLKRIAERSK